MMDRMNAPQVGERLKRKFRELGIAYIDDAKNMSDAELKLAAANLHQWRDDCLAKGEPVFPPNVCVTCFRQHLGQSEACKL